MLYLCLSEGCKDLVFLDEGFCFSTILSLFLYAII